MITLGLGGYDHREALDWYKDVRDSEAIKRSRPLKPKAVEEIGKNFLVLDLKRFKPLKKMTKFLLQKLKYQPSRKWMNQMRKIQK